MHEGYLMDRKMENCTIVLALINIGHRGCMIDEAIIAYNNREFFLRSICLGITIPRLLIINAAIVNAYLQPCRSGHHRKTHAK